MRLTVIGSSPAWPNPGGAQSGYLVEGAGRLLLDCGPGVLARLREQEHWPRVDAIAITHFHLDHWGDLVPWVWGVMHRGDVAAVRPELWLPPLGAPHLRTLGGLLGYPEMFEDAFSVREYDAGAPFRAGGFDVTALRMPHYRMESYGFRVSDGAAVLAYSGDAGPGPELAELARGADLFVCEATLAEPEEPPRGHISEGQAEQAFLASGARRLLLTHRPSDRPLDPRFELAHDGLVVEVAAADGE